MKLLETGSDEESRLATKFVARIANAAFEGAEQARPTTSRNAEHSRAPRPSNTPSAGRGPRPRLADQFHVLCHLQLLHFILLGSLEARLSWRASQENGARYAVQKRSTTARS